MLPARDQHAARRPQARVAWLAVTADRPTVVATSGGFLPGRRTFLRPGPLVELALRLGAPDGGPLRFTALNTAGGDQGYWAGRIHEAFYDREDVRVTVLTLFPMPNVADLRAHLQQQDVVWVGGGSVANLLAVWRLHGVDVLLREAWERGVVLGGVSAGSICWHVGGTTDSYGPDLRAVTNGLGLLPYGNGVHYDSEAQRRPLLHRLVGDGTLPTSHATDDGAGLVYHGTELVEAVADRPGALAYRVRRTPEGTGVEETALPTRLLADPHADRLGG
jgi:peptidase E